MTEAKSKPLVFLEYGLLAVCLCTMAIRCVFTEGVNLQAGTRSIDFADSVYGLSMSALLISAFVVWLVCSFCSKRFLYRFSGIEIGLFLFCIGGVVASLAAEDKRAAITGFTMTLALVLMAVLLVQILDSAKKVKLLLAVIVAAGVLGALYCGCQFLWVNDIIIEQYQNDPQEILEQLGIQGGSFKQMLFENSLSSKDVRGFFTTGNSAGSFALLACFAAVALFSEKVRNRKSNAPASAGLVVVALAAAVIVFGLIITHSKGAIGTSLLAAVMFVTFLCFGEWLKAHKKAILILCILLVIAGGCAAVLYGLAHDRLPGGNSMLVRWQYWRASAEMYADHPFTGVGPGNFVHFYPRYKPAAALETVADPHNFLLSIITQYGPLGLVGFLAAVFIPLGRAVSGGLAKSPQDALRQKQNSIMIAALFCAIVAFLVHNCIDFAIFEGGVLMTFWAIIAAVIALDCSRECQQQLVLKGGTFIKTAAAAGGLVVIFSYVGCALIPVAKSTSKIRQAHQANSDGQLERAHNLLSAAAEDDRLSAAALSINGRLYLQRFYSQPTQNRNLLLTSEKCLLDAIGRNKASFKNFEKLTEVYLLLAETSPQQLRADRLNKALDSARQAVARYPGCGRLRVKLAQIAEQLGEIALAIEQYKQAVDIEDSYREQFRIMYPGREIFSRLGQQPYEYAKQRIKVLCEQ